MNLKPGDKVKRVYRESQPEKDTIHTILRLNPAGTKAVLRGEFEGQPAGKAVVVKLQNIKEDRPTTGVFNGTFYVGS